MNTDMDYAYSEGNIPPIEKNDVLLTEITDYTTPEAIADFKPTVTITDANFADRAVRRVIQLQSQQEYVDKLYKIQKSQLDAYKRKEVKRILANVEFWTDRLAEYYESLKEQGIVSKKEKGFSLPHGRLQTHIQKDKYDFTGVGVDYLERIDPDMVKMVKVIDEEVAKKRLFNYKGKVVHTPTGQVVEGVTITTGVVNFYVQGV